MPVVRVLVIEDDGVVSESLSLEGYDVEPVGSGAGALARLGDDDPFDLLVLDGGVPDVEAMALCRRVRERHPALPVLMLSADGSELDEVQGLDAGADDYVARPFTLAVLAAHVRALLRREANIEAAGVRLDRAARLAWRDERELALAPKEFDLLATLVAHAGTVLSRDELMRLVWDANWFGSTRTLDTHVGWLRRKLGEPPLITTVRGVGFRFERP